MRRSICCWGVAPADDQVIELLVETGFDDERGFDDGEFRAAGTIERGKPFEDDVEDARVEDLVEAGAFCGVSENDGAEFRAIDCITGAENRIAKFANDFVVGGLAGLEQFVAERVHFEDHAILVAEQGGDGGFAGGDAAGESDFKHIRVRGAAFRSVAGSRGDSGAAAQTRGSHRVAHEHGDGERTDAAGNGRDGSGDICDVGMNVADDGGAFRAE